ncbi:MAG: amino acid permease [Bacillota bacterium]|nr:amino acid permease [Bacillota bacterium]
MDNNQKTLGMIPLVFFSVGCTLASGVFAISGDYAYAGAYTLGTIIGWAITFVGMLGLVGCFFRLTIVKPELTSGIYSYAKAGFGEFIGFQSAWGYWISAVLAYVTFSTGFLGSLSELLPFLGDGMNFASLIIGSVILWLLVWLLLNGVNQAVIINAVAVIFKCLPILFLVIAALVAGAFSWDTFTANFTGEGSGMSVFEQAKACIFTTVWVFIGIEGAVVISTRAKTTKLAGKASIISFVSLFALYFIISMLSMGVADHDTLCSFTDNYTFSMAGVMEYIVGPWGATLVNVAAVISIGCALLTYVILVSDSAFGPANMNCFPKIFVKKNKKDQPTYSIIFGAIFVEIFMIVATISAASYQNCYYLSTIAIMIPYMLSAFYAFKLSCTGELTSGQSGSGKMWTWIAAIIGSIYGIWMLYASSFSYILVCALMYLPGSVLYFLKRKEDGGKLFPKAYDLGAFIVVAALFVLFFILVASGNEFVLSGF